MAAGPAGAAVIDGPKEVAAGHPAWFQITGLASGASAAWFPSAHLQAGPPHLVECSALFWTQTPGSYTVNAIAVDWEAKRLTPLMATVQVVGDGPLPPPDPDPPIPPPTPDPLTGLALLAYDWALSETPTVKRVEYATGLAGSFSGMAAKIAAGTVSKPQDIIDQTTAANRAAIGETGRAAWLPWFERLRVYLNAESKAGRLVTPEHYAAAWRQIAKGLEAVR